MTGESESLKLVESESERQVIGMPEHELARCRKENFFQLIDHMSVGFGWRQNESKNWVYLGTNHVTALHSGLRNFN